MALPAGVGVRDGSGLEPLLLSIGGDLGYFVVSFLDALVAGAAGDVFPPYARPKPVNPPYLGLPWSLFLLSSNLVTGFGSEGLAVTLLSSAAGVSVNIVLTVSCLAGEEYSLVLLSSGLLFCSLVLSLGKARDGDKDEYRLGTEERADCGR